MKDQEVIKILEWNLNFGGSDRTIPAAFIGQYIEGNDVVVFTEVRANERLISMIQAWGYDYIVSDDPGEVCFNQSVILAQKRFKLAKMVGALHQSNGAAEPDFLHGMIMVGEKAVNLIGARVKTTGYVDRYMQAKLIGTYIAALEGPVICVGDFNSGQNRGLDDANYSDVCPLYRYQNRSRKLSDLRLYNFHIIRDLLGNRFVLRETMGEENSWGLLERDGRLVYDGYARVKNDLLFYSEDIEGMSKYSWEHVRQHELEYLDMFIKHGRRCGNKVDHGYPDHARLLAELVV